MSCPYTFLVLNCKTLESELKIMIIFLPSFSTSAEPCTRLSPIGCYMAMLQNIVTKAALVNAVSMLW